MAISMPAIEASAPTYCVCYSGDFDGDAGGCVCPDAEKALRMFSAGQPVCQMTPEQREECLVEIASVEGYRRDDYQNESDQTLARGVLCAWTDFCRDKGIL